MSPMLIFGKIQQIHYVLKVRFKSYFMTKRLIRQVGYKPSRYIPASVRHRVFERDHYTCSFCGSQEDLTLDHYVALSLGGTHDESNLVTACRSCNSRKGKVGAAYVIHRLTAGKRMFGG